MSKDHMAKQPDSSSDNSRSLTVAQQETVAAEQKLQLLISSVKDYGIFLIDPEGYIQSWNDGAERIKGYKASEIIGKHFSIFYTAEDIKRNHPAFELEWAKEHGRYEEEGWRVRKDGTRFWASVVITAMREVNGELVGFAKVTRDLTERKINEERLKDSEKRARQMFEGVKDYAMIMLDSRGYVTTWNEGARRIKGYEADEIIGKYFSIFYPEQDVQMGKCEYELKEAAETGRFEDEGWRVRKDGTKFWANVLITAVRNEHGKVTGFSKVTRDITDKKRADDLLKMAYANLEKRVEERTAELLSTNEQLKDAIRVRDEFLSIASHELRTPLTPLKLQIQSLISHIQKKTFSKLGEERLCRMADTADRALTRITGLVDNLLDVSRLNAGKFSLNYEILDLGKVIREILERFKQQIIASGSTVDFVEVKTVIGSFDQIRIEQILVNLLTNALKYGAGRPIRISLTSEDGEAIFMFQDKGVGIANQDLEKVFQRFERVNTNTNIGGMGLGLYITRQIVEAHGGSIVLESTVGEGSTFIVKIPMQKPGNA